MPGCNHCPSDVPAADHRFRRVLWLALVVNAAMFLVEVIASWVSGSLALQADALDFLGDSFNYAISLVVLPMGLATRARAALLKGGCMAAFGVWVLAYAGYRAINGLPPDATIMGVMGFVALAANVSVAVLLYRYRGGDANMRSVWLCSRNDAVANVAVILAAAGVFATASHWPDLLVAAVIAGLALHASMDVIRQATTEIRQGDCVETPRIHETSAAPEGAD
jgi:Co/Zn/Cd efflux system component